MNAKVLLEELALKAGLTLQDLHEGEITALESITINEDNALKLRQLMTETEAVNSPSIVQKYKDKVHQETVLAVNQSYESTQSLVVDDLSDEDKKSFNELKTGKEKNKFLLTKLKEQAKLAKENGSTADVKVLEGVISELKSNNEKVKVDFDSLTKRLADVEKTEKSNKSLLKAIKRDSIISVALKSDKVGSEERSKPLFEDTAVLAVEKHLQTKRYGTEQTQAVLFFDEEQAKYVVRQKGNTELGVANVDKVLSMDDLVLEALEAFGMTKKSDANNTRIQGSAVSLPETKFKVGLLNKYD